jgi:hypothetical protein
MTYKTIALNEKYLPNITSIDEIKNETRFVLENLYSKFMNEKNFNNFEKASNDLEDYRYVPKQCVIPNGCFIRQLDVSNHNDIKLSRFGFVMESNKYCIKVIYRKKTYFINWKNSVIFVKLRNDDVMRSNLESLLEK